MKQKKKAMKQDSQEKNESMIITGWKWKKRVSKLSTSLHNIAVAQLRAAWDFFVQEGIPIFRIGDFPLLLQL
jgi:hypothetical protein